jgi:hypothetical protein
VKYLLQFAFIAMLGHMVHAQNEEKKSNLDLLATDWMVLTVQSQVTIDYKSSSCNPGIGYKKENIILRFTNTSNESVKITWHALLEYNGICKTCDYPAEYSYELILKPNEVIEGDCSLNYDNRVVIFSKYLDKRYTGNSQLTDFELGSLTIQPAQ